jgi:tetratricopeptide (TPR) repeat protein
VYLLVESSLALGYAHRRQAAWGAAIELFEIAEAAIRQTDNRLTTIHMGAYQAECCALAGRFDAAARRAAEVSAVAGQAGSRHYSALARRVEGMVLAERGDHAGAAAAFDEAIDGLEALESRLELGRALYYRGRLRQSVADREGAGADLKRALELFEACGARADAEAAQSAFLRNRIDPL